MTLTLVQVTAWIINIGTELTIGRIVNTNGVFLARELHLRGVDVRRIICVPDIEDEVIPVLREAINKANIVITTGGLGPTADDQTALFLAKALNRKLVLNRDALDIIREKYRSVGLHLTPDREKMAYLPEGARPIPNPVGTAPGIHIILSSTHHVFALPGVPSEMEAMFREYVLNAIEPLLPNICIIEEGVIVRNLPESSLAPLLRKASKLCSDCYVKSHPKGEELRKPIIDVRVVASANTCDEARLKAIRVIEELVKLVGAEGGVVENSSKS